MDLPVIDTAAADAYFATTARDGQWSALDDPTKDIALNEAQVWLGQLCWDPTADCCANDFVLSYTRAVSELALALKNNPTALIPTGAAATGAIGAVKRQKLGDLEVEYYPTSGGAAATTGSGRGPLVLRTFPWLRDIVGCWLHNGSSNLVYRVRS